jgi:predicted metal-binding membrane protein
MERNQAFRGRYLAQLTMTDTPSPLERLLRRDRQIVLGALAAVTVLAWIYTMGGVGMGSNAFEMSSMPWTDADDHKMTMSMPVSELSYFFILLTMWWVMMIAMMLPSATPTILLAAALNRRSTSDFPPYGAAAFFTLGYLLAWFLFSLAATFLQLLLQHGGFLTAMMSSSSVVLSAGLLIAAGVWQFSSIKQACLRHCRSPVDFITRRRRPGNRGAIMMGLEHGTYCLGCCWFLMALLFAGGIMNLYWIAGLALFVLLEKLLPRGVWFGRVAGAGLITTGIVLLLL